jgi:hypothetical protein
MSGDHQTRLLAVLLSVSLLAVGTPLGVAAGDAGSGGFAENTVSVTRGDTLEVTVSHSDTAHVFVGSEHSGFLLEVVLGGSGTDTFTIDTYASTGSPSSFVSGASSVTLHTPQLSRPLAATDYDMNVTVGGVEQDIGRVTVEPRGEMNATTRIAPESLIDETPVAVGTALDSSVENRTVAVGDVVVVPIYESGLANAFNPDDLDGDANANGVAVRLEELDPEPNTEAEQLVVTEDAGFSVRPDLENDRVLVLWDTGTRTLQANSNHTWRLDVVLTEANGLVAEDTRVASTVVELESPYVEANSQSDRAFYPWEEAVVSVNGSTNRAPGTVLNVRAKSVSTPFLVQRDATVTENYTFGATLDVSAATSGDPLPAWVLHNRQNTERTVVRYAEHATIDLRDQVSNGRALEVESARLEAGGFLTVHHNGSRIGVSDHLAPGTHEEVGIDLAPRLPVPTNVTVVAHLDRDLDGAYNASTDRAYVGVAGENATNTTVSETAAVRLQGTGVTTTTATTTPTTTGSTTMTPTTHLAAAGPLVERTPIPALASADSGVNVPFPGWAAAVALLAGGFLARRRGGEAA